MDDYRDGWQSIAAAAGAAVRSQRSEIVRSKTPSSPKVTS